MENILYHNVRFRLQERMETIESERPGISLLVRVSTFHNHDRTLRIISGYLADVFATIVLLLTLPQIMLDNLVILLFAGMASAIITGIIVQIIDYFYFIKIDLLRVFWFAAGSFPVVFLRLIIIIMLWI